MCAIVGFINYNLQAEEKIIENMKKSLVHRGPDDDGTLILSMVGSKVSNVGIGFNRLSIRDLSNSGHQPMSNAKKDIYITFNGEIYNSEQFKKELNSKGYTFRGSSDTEVLLYLYEQFGIDGLLQRIDGMYAICIADIKNDCIYLIRDKIGEKPLYIYQNEEVLLWASEYKAFYCHPLFKAEINYDGLTEYLMFRYVSDGKTLLKNVCNVQPGSYIKISKDGICSKTYWSIPDVREDSHMDYIQAKKKLSGMIQKAVQTRMVSDVEVGIQLSGGVDSSYLTAVANKISNTQIKTFGIVFDGKSYSEKEYMDYVVSRCNVESNLYDLKNEDFYQSWINTTYYFESPMNHEGSMGLYYLNKNASKKIKVMLCGEGSDEVLGGYNRFYLFAMYRKYPWLNLILSIRRALSNKGFKLDNVKGYDLGFIQSTQYVSEIAVKKIFPKGNIDNILNKRKKILMNSPGKGMRKFMNYEIITYCQDLLMRADKVSMANSIEIRVPFLMPELLEYVCSIPSKYLVEAKFGHKMRRTKKILKDLCVEEFGEKFAYRKKSGFGIPLVDYFYSGSTKEYIERNLLPNIKKRRLFNYEYIYEVWRKLLDETDMKIYHPNDDMVQTLWVAFSFEIWAEMFLDNNPNDYAKKEGIFESSTYGVI